VIDPAESSSEDDEPQLPRVIDLAESSSEDERGGPTTLLGGETGDDDAATAANLAGPLDAAGAIASRCLDELTGDEQSRVTAARSAPRTVVLVSRFNIDVTGADASRLRQNARHSESLWLNDEIINFYSGLLAERDAEVCRRTPGLASSHFVSTYFINKLLGDRHDSFNYASVRRWTKGVDIFRKRFICIPVNEGYMHWTLIVIDVPNKTIRHFDSYAKGGDLYLRSTLRYLKDEHMDKKRTPLPNPDAWTLVPSTRENTPRRQENGYDCGVFASFCAHYASLGVEPNFSQDDVTRVLRRRLLLSILNEEIPI